MRGAESVGGVAVGRFSSVESSMPLLVAYSVVVGGVMSLGSELLMRKRSLSASAASSSRVTGMNS